MSKPRLSVVLLTLNEERNIGPCLASLAQQTTLDFEVILVDAASTDRTLALARAAQPNFPAPLRIEASTRRLPIGEARNLGVSLAVAPVVAFLSADAEMSPRWIEFALEALKEHDMVFGPQTHAPHEWTIGAAVRGLRYAFPEKPPKDPLRFASNVAAAYKKEILQALPFDAWANAAEDLLLAKRATAAGWRATYHPRMTVKHHDVATTRQELRKSVREGEGWGLYRAELGLFRPVLYWGLAIVFALVTLAFSLALGLILLILVLWLPALRRALRRHQMPLGSRLKGLAASPFFDLAFLASYLRGLATRPEAKIPKAGPLETNP